MVLGCQDGVEVVFFRWCRGVEGRNASIVDTQQHSLRSQLVSVCCFVLL